MRTVCHVVPANMRVEGLKYVKGSDWKAAHSERLPGCLVDCTSFYGRKAIQMARLDSILQAGPDYVITPEGASLDELRFYYSGCDHTKILYVVDELERSAVFKALDCPYTDGIILRPGAGRSDLLCELNNTIRIGKEVWLIEFEMHDIKQELYHLSFTEITVGLITDIAAAYGSYGVIMNSGTTKAIEKPHFVYWRRDMPLDFILLTRYNSYVIECWFNGVNPMGFVEFLKGVE